MQRWAFKSITSMWGEGKSVTKSLSVQTEENSHQICKSKSE